MPSPTELDIFARSLGGDRRARTELYRKFIHENSRVRRLGKGYPDPNDFLQDCFKNLLRTGHSWDKEQSLSSWAERVAAWTALENERKRDMSDRGAKGEIRMCAELETEDPAHGELISAYAPPLQGADDSPSARILALLNEPEKTVFRKRAMEMESWQATAAAVGKPITAVGPIFARVIDRFARLFGAPPATDDDLATVFSRAAADPLQAEGRAASLQLDNAFYTVSPEMRSIGLGTSHGARLVALWNSATSDSPPSAALHAHLAQCQCCGDVLRALILMQHALRSGPGMPFHLCPGSFTLANTPEVARDAFNQHLAACEFCREERTEALAGHAPRHVREAADQDTEQDAEQDPENDPTAGAGKKIAWASAVLLLVGLASFGGYRYLADRKAEVPTTPSAVTNDHPTPTVAQDLRYAKLVQNPKFDDPQLIASIAPENRPAATAAIDQILFNSPAAALSFSRGIATKGTDPGAQLLFAMSLYKVGLTTDGYGEMLKAEAMTPRSAYRCWVMFQFALLVADKKVIEREAGHLANDPHYKQSVQKTMARVRELG